jgi:hypothetical protein
MARRNDVFAEITNQDILLEIKSLRSEIVSFKEENMKAHSDLITRSIVNGEKISSQNKWLVGVCTIIGVIAGWVFYIATNCCG